jgi:hypothetical protein
LPFGTLAPDVLGMGSQWVALVAIRWTVELVQVVERDNNLGLAILIRGEFKFDEFAEVIERWLSNR